MLKFTIDSVSNKFPEILRRVSDDDSSNLIILSILSNPQPKIYYYIQSIFKSFKFDKTVIFFNNNNNPQLPKLL